ncbi:hypothetical protein B0T25DRAFT_567031 [Lasiosphaeria hispida]|uniref:AA1-like domain-containing protein n=1 Tax=Lasiosphaeria hispida TaxID=260671 RepID=A0AAJ0HMT6_9PEZI|nr:hypothetical protein B0T25DRAFT_567031 [Lasiosphaeria hispida]
MHLSPLLAWAATASALHIRPTHSVAGAISARVPEPGTIEIHPDTATPAVAEHDVVSHATVGVDMVETRDAAYRVPTCKRKDAKLHLQRQWSISYDGDGLLNGYLHCGQSVHEEVKKHFLCRPLTDWTCVASGIPGMGGVTVQFHTPRTCRDESIKMAVSRGTRGRVEVSCQHL